MKALKIFFSMLWGAIIILIGCTEVVLWEHLSSPPLLSILNGGVLIGNGMFFLIMIPKLIRKQTSSDSRRP